MRALLADGAEKQPPEPAHPAGPDDEQGGAGGGIEQGAAREIALDAARHVGVVADRSGDTEALQNCAELMKRP